MVSRSTRASPLVMLLGAIFFLASHVFAASAVLGVDLGTEYIKAALVKPGIPLDIVLTKDSRRKEASAVAFKPSRGGAQAGSYPERLYGSDAMALAARFPGEVYPNLKPLLGLPIDNAIVQEYAARHPALQLQAHSTRNTAAFKSNTVSAEEEAWLVEELLAMELQSIQKNAEATAGDGTTVKSVVLTVPPFYTLEEKRALRAAADLAGLKVLSLISDGLAVGLNYATSHPLANITAGEKPQYHMVFDMGAGSTTASVMRFQSRDTKAATKYSKAVSVSEVQVMGSGWDRILGGDALNNLIIDDMVNQFVESKGGKKVSATVEGVKAHGRAMAKITKDAEKARHVLSANQNTQASFEGLYEDADFKYKITRAEFEKMAEEYTGKLETAINDALKMSGLDMLDIESIILHGGASRTPFVQKALEKIAGSADKLRSNVNSDEAAVFGAGFRAAGLSPSFRVKDIRISEGSSYPVGISYTSGKGKQVNQKLWKPTSVFGGPAKEVTFEEQETDFEATFYQEINGENAKVQDFATKNLTATLASVKEKYPSCIDSGIVFRVGAQLNTENGEVEVVKAAIECEAEAKEGLMDGVKNLFGFGKKDQEPLKGDEEEAKTETVDAEKESDKKADASSSTAGAESTESASADGAEGEGSTEELKAEAKKIEHVSIPVEFTLSKAGTPELSKAQQTKAKDRLKAFASSDKARVQREEALNQLEAYAYKVRDLVEDDTFIAVSSEVERKVLAEKASATSEWLYDDGSDAPKDELKAKLKELQDLAVPIQKRKEEKEKRPELIKKMTEALDQTSKFLETMHKQIKEYDEYQAAEAAKSSTEEPAAEASADEFEGLEDDEPVKEKKAKKDKKEEATGPIPPLYKSEDLTELEALAKSTGEWLKEMEPKQAALAATADPVLLAKDLEAKRVKLEQVGKDLAVKGARNFGDKKKKAGGKDKSKDKKSGSGAKKGGKTIKVGDRDYSPEELEEMINGMTDEDWEQVKEGMARQSAGAGGEEKKEEEPKKDEKKDEPKHDEL